MAANQAVDMNDDELNSLMEELESLTADAVEPPKVSTPVLTLENDDLELALDELENTEPVSAPEPIPEPIPEPVAEVKPVADQKAEVNESTEEDSVPKAQTNGVSGLRFFIDPNKMQEDMVVNERNLDEVMMTQASSRTYYGVMHANAEAQAARVKLRAKVQEAKLYDKHRKALLAETGAKVTEKAIENAVHLDPDYLRIHNIVIEAEAIAATNKAAVEGIKDRRDMAIQLGADRRDDNKGALRTMAREDEANLSKRIADFTKRA